MTVWHKKWFQFSILLALAMIWGSSFILIKIGLKSFSNTQSAALRLFFASLVLLPLAWKNRSHFSRKDLKSLLIAAFIGSFIPAFLFTKAQTRIDSATAGILNSLTPVFTLIVGLLWHRTRVTGWQITGLFLGLLGAVGLITQGTPGAISFNSYGFFVVLATLCYGFNVNQIKSYLTHLNGIRITAFSFMFIFPAATLWLLTEDFSGVPMSPGWGWHLSALAVLGIIGTAFAMLLMNSLIRYTSAVFASSVTYIIPVFAILWGLADGEIITAGDLGFMAVILGGVYLINSRRPSLPGR
ncbi:MAG: DMT family transporter [Bacteroidales bacterium]